MTTTTHKCAGAGCSRPVARRGQKCAICRKTKRRSAARRSLGRGGGRRSAADVLARGSGSLPVNGAFYATQSEPADAR